MAIKIKNQLYQQLPITDDKGLTIMLASREKRTFDNLNIDNLPKPVQGLQRKNFVKIKKV